MSDEQTMPEVIYAWEVPGDCEKPQWDVEQPYFYNGTPYLRCPDNVDPSTIAKGLADMAATIATLTAERDALVAAIGVALPLLDRVPGDEYTLDEHDDIRIMKEMHLAAQLKEQDDDK